MLVVELQEKCTQLNVSYLPDDMFKSKIWYSIQLSCYELLQFGYFDRSYCIDLT